MSNYFGRDNNKVYGHFLYYFLGKIKQKAIKFALNSRPTSIAYICFALQIWSAQAYMQLIRYHFGSNITFLRE